jgi:uncharacterized protein (DUF427 family)
MTEATRGRVRVGWSDKRIRAFLDGHLVVESIHAALVWETPHYPTYYFPIEDVRAELRPIGEVRRSPSRGDAVVYDVIVGESTAPRAALRHVDSPLEDLRNLVRIEWDAMSEWFEEDEVVYTHARDPFTRVDVLASSRHVRVEVDGLVVADSTRPHLLFETGLPARYYLPPTDVRMDLLRPSSSESYCPYKGTAGYWTLEAPNSIKPDFAWTYRTPLPEGQKVAGLIGFYNEQADIYVDGVLQERPKSRAA